MRTISRRKYLGDREQKQLRALEDTIKDEEYLFQGVELTPEERRVQELQRTLLKFVKERMDIVAKKRASGYYIPAGEVNDDGKIDRQAKMALLDARYQDVDETPRLDQDIWADHQVG